MQQFWRNHWVLLWSVCRALECACIVWCLWFWSVMSDLGLFREREGRVCCLQKSWTRTWELFCLDFALHLGMVWVAIQDLGEHTYVLCTWIYCLICASCPIWVVLMFCIPHLTIYLFVSTTSISSTVGRCNANSAIIFNDRANIQMPVQSPSPRHL
jgi:hypothetical protein